MGGFCGAVKEEVVNTIRRPRRLRHALEPRRLAGYVGYLWWRVKLPDRWQDTGAFERRRYRDYETYLNHQSQKLASLDLEDYDRSYSAILGDRIKDLDLRGQPVLCLAARIGTEVKAFRARGAFAVGIDLNPGPKNQYVTYGDFHRLPFDDRSAAVVFTNSLDHAFDIDAVLEEARRVLSADGVLVVEAVVGTREGKGPQFYESFSWDSIDSLIARIETRGLRHTFAGVVHAALEGSAPALRRRLILGREGEATHPAGRSGRRGREPVPACRGLCAQVDSVPEHGGVAQR